MAFYVLMFR